MARVDGDNDHHHRLRFTCPASSCSLGFDETSTYGEFVEHTSTHGSELFTLGINVCPLGCRLGFSDAIQQRAHLLSGCSCIPPTVRRAVGSIACGYRGCSQKYGSIVSMRSHFMKKHGSRVYEDPSARYKDDICRLGFPDAGSIHSHMTAQYNKGGHVCMLLKNWGAATWIADQYTTPESDLHHLESDILCSVISYPAPATFYDLDVLDKQLLSVDDLVLLWEQNITGIQMAVQYPEATARREVVRVANSVRSAGILSWNIPKFTPSMIEGDPKTLLSQSLSDP
jgi:hypothetical protein